MRGADRAETLVHLKWVSVMLSAVLFVLGLSDGWQALHPRPFERVQAGMREVDVVALLGKPGAETYSCTLCTHEARDGKEVPVCLPMRGKKWRDHDREVNVDFDQDGVVRRV